MKQHDVILVAEDDENHVLLLKRAFKQSNCLNPVFYVEDGEQVIAYLEGRDKYSNHNEFPLPSLLLLDIKMPNKNGLEVLAWIRGHPTFGILPVVVLSSSGDTGDIKRAWTQIHPGGTGFPIRRLNYRQRRQDRRATNL